MSGCPRVPKETFDRLKGLKNELEEAIKEERKKYDQ